MIRCVVAGIAAGCLATVLAGCGGSGHGASAGKDTSWAEQAEAICAQTEATIRQRAPAESSRDLERLMAAVVDDLRAGRSDLDALEPPEDQRKKAETFLRDVDKVVKVAEKIRDARRDHVKIWMVSYDARVTALDLEEDARAAGLRRCGREASTKAVDAVMMPGYAQDVAKMILPIIALVEAAEQIPQPGHSEAYWKAVAGVIDPDGTGREPESLSDLETDFTQPLKDAEVPVGAILLYYDDPQSRPAREIRDKERRTYAVLRKAPAKGYELLKATGPPGEALLPRVKQAVRKAVERVG